MIEKDLLQEIDNLKLQLKTTEEDRDDAKNQCQKYLTLIMKLISYDSIKEDTEIVSEIHKTFEEVKMN